MKKLISVCIMLLILFGLCAAPVFASDEDVCVIEFDFNVIHYGGKVYRCMDFKRVELIDESSISSLEYSFKESEEAENYKYVGISISEEYPHILFARFSDPYDNYYTWHYVEESRVLEVYDFIFNRIGGKFHTPSTQGDMPIGADVLQDWLASEEYLSIPPAEMEYNRVHKLIRQSPELGLTEHVGDILETYDESGQPVFYLIHYPDYSEEYFYASGSFSMEGDRRAQFLRLADEELTQKLSTYYGIVPEEDDLEWVVPDELSETAVFWMTLILFGILPVALMAFCLVWIFVKQPKNPYFAVLCVIIFAAAEVAIAYVTLALLLR